MAKYAVGYLIAFLVLAVFLAGFVGLGQGVTEIGIRERPGIVVFPTEPGPVPFFPEPAFPDPAFPPAPDTGR